MAVETIPTAVRSDVRFCGGTRVAALFAKH
jgi:hypothetical protein